MANRVVRLVAAAALVLGCSGGVVGGGGTIPGGTWGGENAAVLATDTSAHVHIGCTNGDTQGPIVTDAGGRFSLGGLYNITAHPVDRGIFHPARFDGWTDGKTMSLTVALSDTAVTLGPVQVILGRTPELGPCPICRR